MEHTPDKEPVLPFPPPVLLGRRHHQVREARVSLPELALISAAAAMLGRRDLACCWCREIACPRTSAGAVGWTLFLIGGLSTIPLAFEVLGRARLSDTEGDEWVEFPASAPRPELTILRCSLVGSVARGLEWSCPDPT